MYFLYCRQEDELIDTLWNVNFFFLSISISVAAELIDTLWNVNLLKYSYTSSGVGINRYIMECKSESLSYVLRNLPELIDTLWNVNYLPSVSNFEPIARINRYIMECKCVSRSTLLSVRLLELIDTLWNVNAKILVCRR